MFTKLRKLLLADDADQTARKAGNEAALQGAAAALLVVAGSLDGHFSATERDAVGRVLRARFGLDAEQAESLLCEGEAVAAASSQIYAFTRTLKDRLDAEERIRIIEMLWEVALADGVLHDYEAHLVRRVAGLLYVPDRESGTARQRVRARLDSSAESPK